MLREMLDRLPPENEQVLLRILAKRRARAEKITEENDFEF